MTTRTEIARELGVAAQQLCGWESVGLLPRFRPAIAREYRDRVALILAGRRLMSMQRVRASLATGGC